MVIDYNKVFPETIAQGVTGGPEWLTQVTQLRSGSEYRNTPWSEPLFRFDAALGLRDEVDLKEFSRFYYSCQGMLKSFRFKDWSDYSTATNYTLGYTSSDELLGTGDGSTYYFRTNKTYGTFTRRIWAPRLNRCAVAIDGTEVDQDDFFVDETNGTVVFVTAPPNGSTLSWGGEYDVITRFDSDYIPTSMRLFNIGEVPNIPIVGLRPTESIDTATYDNIRDILGTYSKSDLIDLSNIYDYTVNTHWKGFWEYANLI